jgi:uncharacterized flavoprotein (TIGR03862 family)
MAAETLVAGGAEVTVYEQMRSAGRKFLMAGRGGLNLTHSEALPAFLSRYGAGEASLRAAIEAFPPETLRAWAQGLGQETFVGSSGRVFPKAMKASPLLRTWLRRLDAAGVRFAFEHRWMGWDEGRLVFETPNGVVRADVAATVLALGGASWPRLGSNAAWVEPLTLADVRVSPLKPSNAGFTADWSEHFKRHAGQPLKRLALSFGDRTVRGEAILTETGLEGGGIYALSPSLRDAIEREGTANLHIALRPEMAADEIGRRLTLPRGKQSLSTFLRKALNLSPAEIGLLQEATGGKLATLAPVEIATLVNNIEITLIATAPVTRAISTAGGIAFDEIDTHFMLHKLPGVFAAGEMLDWEAPTGGYLLQACFATGAAAGRGVLEWLSRQPVTR